MQHVTEPTHARGHTLDLVITKSDTDVLSLRVGGLIDISRADKSEWDKRIKSVRLRQQALAKPDQRQQRQH